MATAAEMMMSGHFRLGGGEDLNARVGRTSRGRPRLTRLVEVRSKTIAPLVSVPETVEPPEPITPAAPAGAAVVLNIDEEALERFIRTVERYAAAGAKGRQRAYLHATVRRLSIFADDDQVRIHAPERVAEALQAYGHLLQDRQIKVLREWLEEGA